MKALLAFALLLALKDCTWEEKRDYRPDPGAAETTEKIALSPLSPGSSPPEESRSGRGEEFERNAYHISQGKRLFTWFNCTGCHANGGGDSGPALMDNKWIYGGSIEAIVQTITEGRPNGMPSFRGRIPDDQIWEIAAYVRSMGRYTPQPASPGRNDAMHSGPAEQRRPAATPVEGGGAPPSGERPQ